MSQQSLVNACLHNLKLQLESVCSSSNPETQRSVEKALAYANELKELLQASSAERPAQVGAENGALGDVTNYRMYEQLASFGLSSNQLLAVAQTEGLHDLRKLRMLRTVYGLSLPQAQAALAEAEESK